MILLNDILKLNDLDLNKTKIRFNIACKSGDPLYIFKTNRQQLYEWQYWNYAKKKLFAEEDITIGFIRIERHKWLLFGISRVTKDLNLFNAVGYEYEKLNEYEKFCGRIIIEYHNHDMTLVRKASGGFIDKCKILQILDSIFDNDIFPGYGNVNVSWKELKNVINKNTWKTALSNQKGIYLITDNSNGKMYVGSAYGSNMLHGRWSNYIENGHGGNVELKKLQFEHIQAHFQYSILDIFKSTIDDKMIINREAWWKETLLTRRFGYNKS